MNTNNNGKYARTAGHKRVYRGDRGLGPAKDADRDLKPIAGDSLILLEAMLQGTRHDKNKSTIGKL